jgi:hypothetical protein
MAGGVPDLVIWNVSGHHSSSTNKIPSKAEIIAAADYVADRTRRAGISPDEMIVAMPSAQEVYWFPASFDLHAKIFMDELAVQFPGHTFDYHQTNNNKDFTKMVYDVSDGGNHYCGYHANDSAVILGGNWRFTTIQNASDDGNEKVAYPYCNSTEASWFGSFGIQHKTRMIQAHIFTVQTDGANSNAAASQLASVTGLARTLVQNIDSAPSFIIGDFNGGLGGTPQPYSLSIGGIPITNNYEVITGAGQCPGLNRDNTTIDSTGGKSFPPDLDGTMQIAQHRGVPGSFVLEGYLIEAPPFSTILSARLAISGVGPVPIWDPATTRYWYTKGHVAQAALFKYR